ncbi:hypothetical protein ACE1MS_07245 [Lysinibacillus sp. fkY74-1]|uniref:Uncharacterized protein n=2 Tax=Lysinibacillus TaxID=400634 RepID=W7S677_LYSSH|nr:MULTISPECIES: hypothetical protein [Lysinibacillus]MBE5083683.1 hypothetical protein [Bacillus thuringiensis]AMO34216.1 hypothetical protein AR327_18145 [Lysinibacillus sphaericus]AMR90671.1 hypothetical protein A1T07_11060 [Lysinibacillus sphaericus]ANA44721.1 hypothetical protein A2J09_03730 [Lysinibacillus sphaericus]EWH33721.1 hypothetical protein P799_05865 [Lysinibacillus sphaericus CBAM5]
MSYEDLMQWKGYLFLDNLVEPGTNSLRISIKRAAISSKSDDVSFDEFTFNDVYPIEIDTTLPVIDIEFDSYVSYSIYDESFHFVSQEDEFIGNSVRLFTKSAYLDFISKGTIALDIYSYKELFHYQIVCLDHIIDIVSFDKPTLYKQVNNF